MLTIKIHMDNAAFQDGGAHEVSRILRDIANTLCDGSFDDMPSKLYDYNGNQCGEVKLK